MNASFFSTFFFFLCLGFCSAQTNRIDSLNKLLLNNDATKTEQVNLLNELAWELRNVDRSRAQGYAKEALEESIELKYKKGEATSLSRLGLLEKYKSNYPLALDYFQNALKIRLLLNDTIDIANNYLSIGNIYRRSGEFKKAKENYSAGHSYVVNTEHQLLLAKLYNGLGVVFKYQGDYKKAIVYLLESLKIREILAQPAGVATGYLSLGTLYEKLEHFDKALEQYTMSLAIYQQVNDSIGMLKSFNNIGNIYYYTGREKEALMAYEESLSVTQIESDSAVLSTIYNNIGTIYESQNQLKDALLYHKKALLIRESIVDKKGIASSGNQLGNVEKKYGNYKSALNYYLISYENCLQIGDRFLELDLLKNISETCSLLKRFDHSVLYLNKYNDLKEKLYQDYKEAMDYKLDFEEEQSRRKLMEKETELQLAEYQRKELVKLGLLGFLFFLLITVFFIYRSRKQKQLAERDKEIAQKNQEILEKRVDKVMAEQEYQSNYARLNAQDALREKISQNLHDGFGGTLASISLIFQVVKGKAQMPDKKSNDQLEKVDRLLKDAYEEVRSMAFEMQSGTLRNFGLVSQVKELIKTVQEHSKLKTHFSCHGIDGRLNEKLEFEIYKITQEAVSNVLKHAQAQELNIHYNLQNHDLSILIEDDGKGFHTDSTAKKLGQGLRNIKSRVYNLGGEIEIDSGKGAGTSISIAIPLNKNHPYD